MLCTNNFKINFSTYFANELCTKFISYKYYFCRTNSMCNVRSTITMSPMQNTIVTIYIKYLNFVGKNTVHNKNKTLVIFNI